MKTRPIHRRKSPRILHGLMLPLECRVSPGATGDNNQEVISSSSGAVIATGLTVEQASYICYALQVCADVPVTELREALNDGDLGVQLAFVEKDNPGTTGDRILSLSREIVDLRKFVEIEHKAHVVLLNLYPEKEYEHRLGIMQQEVLSARQAKEDRFRIQWYHRKTRTLPDWMHETLRNIIVGDADWYDELRKSFDYYRVENDKHDT